MRFSPSAWVLSAAVLLGASPLHADFSLQGPGTENQPQGVPLHQLNANSPFPAPVVIDGNSAPARVSREPAQLVSAATMPRMPNLPNVQTFRYEPSAAPAPNNMPSYGAAPVAYAPPNNYAQPNLAAQPYPAPNYPMQSTLPVYSPTAMAYAYGLPTYSGPVAATPTYMKDYAQAPTGPDAIRVGFDMPGGGPVYGYGQPYPQSYMPPPGYAGYGGYGPTPMPPPMQNPYYGYAPGYTPYGMAMPPYGVAGGYYGTAGSGNYSYHAAPPGSGPAVMPGYYSNPSPAPQPEPSKKRKRDFKSLPAS